MQAVCNRAYQAATVVLDVAKKMASVIKEDRSEVNQEVGISSLVKTKIEKHRRQKQETGNRNRWRTPVQLWIWIMNEK